MLYRVVKQLEANEDEAGADSRRVIMSGGRNSASQSHPFNAVDSPGHRSAIVGVLFGLFLLSLTNSWYSHGAFRALEKRNRKTMLNVVILNSLLLAATTCHMTLLMMEMVFGYAHVATHYLVHSLISPLLITLRFTLYTFFTSLVMTPLLKIGNFSLTSRRALSKAKLVLSVFLACFCSATLLLTFMEEYEMLSVAIGAVSFVVADISYSYIAYRCNAVLRSPSYSTAIVGVKRRTTSASAAATSPQVYNTVSYGKIGKFLFLLNIMYAMGHMCQAALYLSSVYYSQ